MDAEDKEILYTILIPIKSYTSYLFCCRTAYADEDFLAIVPGERTDDRYGGAGPDDTDYGWMVALTPKYAKTIDNCIGAVDFLCKLLSKFTLGLVEVFGELFKIFDKFCVLLKTCPITHVTQVRPTVCAVTVYCAFMKTVS